MEEINKKCKCGHMANHHDYSGCNKIIKKKIKFISNDIKVTIEKFCPCKGLKVK